MVQIALCLCAMQAVHAGPGVLGPVEGERDPHRPAGLPNQQVVRIRLP